jgi:hypothetical protein
METSARLYNCARCHQQVILCSHCDYGNIYCFDSCSQRARKISLREANKRYRESRQGRQNAARRQAEFRQRKPLEESSAPSPETSSEKKVTHQGSGGDPSPASIASESIAGCVGEYHCHCCGRPVAFHLRSGFIRHQRNAFSGSLFFQRGG